MLEERTDNSANFTRQRSDNSQEGLTEPRKNTADEREKSWAKLLRGLLPSTYEVVTKGRIISRDGRISREVDVLVLKRGDSQKMLDKNLYLAGCVAAAFDCETTRCR